MNCFVIICSKEYLSYYKILYTSLKKHSPKDKQILFHIGNVEEEFDEKVNITSWYDEAKYNSPLEKICSLRARVVLEAFNKGYEKVIFLGAKLELFQSVEKLWHYLTFYNAIGTPHITSPLPEDGKYPSNASVSFTGHLSTDLVAFKNAPQVVSFLSWQNEIMKTQCTTSMQTYLDQSWLNFLPIFVDNVYTMKDIEYNFAYWRLHQDSIINVKGVWIMKNSGKPLVAFQYSGLQIESPETISSHQNRWTAEGDFLKFLQSYVDRVKK